MIEPAERPASSVFVDDGRRHRRLAVVGWVLGIPLVLWVLLVPAALLGASWVPSLPILPGTADLPAPAHGSVADLPSTTVVAPTTELDQRASSAGEGIGVARSGGPAPVGGEATTTPAAVPAQPVTATVAPPSGGTAPATVGPAAPATTRPVPSTTAPSTPATTRPPQPHPTQPVHPTHPPHPAGNPNTPTTAATDGA